MIWNKEMECASREEMRELQSKRLVELVRYVYERVPFYRQKITPKTQPPTHTYINRSARTRTRRQKKCKQNGMSNLS